MTLRVIGAGVGRTGTNSLQLALEHLLGGRCYHMLEVFPHPEDIDVWHQAALGRPPDWRVFLQDWVAAVDWPASAFWEGLAESFPDALILLSVRDAESWWASASNTILGAFERAPESPWRSMVEAMFRHTFTADIFNKEAAIAAFEGHNDYVRMHAPRARLLEWHPGDGWEPLCHALGLPVPELPFPHVNTTEDFQQRASSASRAD